MALICIFLMISGVEHLLPVDHLALFLGEMSIMSFAHCLIWLSVSLLLSCRSSLHVLDSIPLSDTGYESSS